MIIKRIKADNFMKYKHLEIDNLPSEGIIGIFGPNESGKTTIGAAVHFAFFGMPLDPSVKDNKSLIKWFEQRSLVEVDFTIDGNDDYTVVREMDRSGEDHTIVLETDSREAVARGKSEVEKWIAERIRFNRQDFLDTLFLTQDSPSFIKFSSEQQRLSRSFSGIVIFEKAIEQVQESKEELKRNIISLKGRLEENVVDEEEKRELQGKIEKLEEQENNQQEELKQHEEKQASIKSDIDKLNAHDRKWLEERAEIQKLEKAENAESFENRAIQYEKRPAPVPAPDDGVVPKTLIDEEKKLLDSVKESKSVFRTLQNLKTTVKSLVQNADKEIKDLEAIVLTHKKKMSALQKKKKGSNVWALIFWILLAAVIGLGAVVQFAVGPEKTANWISGQFTGLQLNFVHVYIALGVLALIFLIVAVSIQASSSGKKKSLNNIQSEMTRVEEKISENRDIKAKLEALSVFDLKSLSAAVAELNSEKLSKAYNDFISSHKSLDPNSPDVSRMVSNLMKSIDQQREKIVKEIQQRDGQIKELESKAESIESNLKMTRESLENWREQWKAAEEKEATYRDIENQISEAEKGINVRDKLTELFSRTIDKVRLRFSEGVSRILSQMIGQITDERYHDAQVAEDLSVKVFSREKNNFVEPWELSGGTRDQISLGLRLALCQAGMRSRFKEAPSQFLFLDEPIHSSDVIRSSSLMEVLRSITEDFPQLFLVSHFAVQPEDITVDMHLETGEEVFRYDAAEAKKEELDQGPALDEMS